MPENAQEPPTRLHARIKGRVQGVGFRYFVLQCANERGVSGWVRNRWDGSVEVVAEGARSRLEGLVSDLRRGPRSSFVSDLKLDWGGEPTGYTRFDIRRTG
jgi:acylphosphatase